MLSMRIQELATYEMGMEDGLEKGREKWMKAGREEGIEQGMAQGQAFMVRQVLNRFESQEIAEMTGLNPETVDRLSKSALTIQG